MSKDLPSYFSYTDKSNKLKDAIDDNFIREFFMKYNFIWEPNNFISLYDFIDQHPELSTNFEELSLLILKNNFKNLIGVYIPGNSFISISVTGSECDLTCEHCQKKYLKGMVDVSTQEKLVNVLEKCGKKNGFQGFLISGGCTSDGKVPLIKYSKILSEYKEKYSFLYNLHVGLLEKNEIAELMQIHPDFISFDFTLDEVIINKVYLLEKTPQDYITTLNLLLEAKIRVIPHICIGLNFGRVHKEMETLIYLKQMRNDWDLLVFLILIRPDNPAFAQIDLNSIRTILFFARFLFPTTELSLGCMRPRGKDRETIEKIALNSGFNRFEMLSSSTKAISRELNLRLIEFNACCAIPMDRYKYQKNDNSDYHVSTKK